MVSIKETGILKKVRKGIGARKEAVVVIVVVGVVVVVVMEDRDLLTTPIRGRTGHVVGKGEIQRARNST